MIILTEAHLVAAHLAWKQEVSYAERSNCSSRSRKNRVSFCLCAESRHSAVVSPQLTPTPIIQSTLAAVRRKSPKTMAEATLVAVRRRRRRRRRRRHHQRRRRSIGFRRCDRLRRRRRVARDDLCDEAAEERPISRRRLQVSEHRIEGEATRFCCCERSRSFVCSK